MTPAHEIEPTSSELERRLTRIFHTLTHAALAALAVGCGNEHAGGGERPSNSELLACGATGGAVTRGPVGQPEIPFLGIVAQSLPEDGAPLPRGPYTWQRVAQGVACSGVSELAECERRLDAATASPGCNANPCPNFAVVREGDTFARITAREELLALLGDIDNTSEAILLATFDGHPSSCQHNGESNPPITGTLASPTEGGYRVSTVHEECGNGIYRDVALVTHDGEYQQLERRKVGDSQCVIGRKPVALREAEEPRSATAIGTFLAKAARLEAASVYAFRQLARELLALDAPESLVSATLSAMADELRHAREMTRVARAYGAEVQLPEVAEVPLRTALEIALDNASEGCVRETFGALVATHQAASAKSRVVREAMVRIAQDETRHATLSWELARWLDTRIDGRERARVADTRRATASALARELDMGLTERECAELGYPTPTVASSLLEGLAAQLLKVA